MLSVETHEEAQQRKIKEREDRKAEHTRKIIEQELLAQEDKQRKINEKANAQQFHRELWLGTEGWLRYSIAKLRLQEQFFSSQYKQGIRDSQSEENWEGDLEELFDSYMEVRQDIAELLGELDECVYMISSPPTEYKYLRNL